VSPARWLYLFSSNQSPLYEQDILDVLAAPTGALYRFRYDASYVENSTADEWLDLPGMPVLVLYSMQQEARYHDPVFIPVRKGVVTRTDVVGSRLFVEFRVGKIVALPQPEPNGDANYAQRVNDFTAYVESQVAATPYASSASLGSPIPSASKSSSPPWDTTADESVLFERAAAYLARTDSFRNARFVRFLELRETGGGSVVRPTDEGVFELEAGRTYDLSLLHAQRAAPLNPESYAVDVDGTALHIIGRSGFDIASRYDRVVVRVSATQITGLEDRQTVLAVRPGEGVSGAEIDIQIRVKANRKRAIGIGGMQALALVLVALASTLTMVPLGVRITLAVLGALLAAGLQLVGSAALKTPTMPSAPKPGAATQSPASPERP
jgi:hypothetical protein